MEGHLIYVAERARFELAVSCPTTVFKTVTLNHSVTSPNAVSRTIITDTDDLVEGLICDNRYKYP